MLGGMSRRSLIIVGLVVATVVATMVGRWLLRDEPDDRELLLALINRAAEAAEQRDLKAFRGVISKDYRDDQGRSYQDINQLVTLHFLRRGTISVYVISRTVQVDKGEHPTSAKGTVTAVLSRRPRVEQLSDILPESARGLRFELGFVKDDEWQVRSATWDSIRDLGDLIQ